MAFEGKEFVKEVELHGFFYLHSCVDKRFVSKNTI